MATLRLSCVGAPTRLNAVKEGDKHSLFWTPTCSTHNSAVLPRQVMAALRLSGFRSSATIVFTAPEIPIKPLFTSAANASAYHNLHARVGPGGFLTRVAACNVLNVHLVPATEWMRNTVLTLYSIPPAVVLSVACRAAQHTSVID